MREVMRQAVQLAKTNLVDRIVRYFDPERGLARLRHRTMLSLVGGYEGARRDRNATKAWKTSGNSPDADILPDLPMLRDRSRDLSKNNPIAAGAINTIVDGVVATGLSLQSKPDWKTLGITKEQAVELGHAIDRGFRMWSESTDCDITRTQNFYGLQELAFRGCVESGDSFALLVKAADGRPGLCIQVVEADRVENPQGVREDETRISGGVEKDSGGAPIAYHFLKRHPGSLQGAAREYDRIPAFGDLTGRRNVLHLYRRTRPGQSRGVPDLAPVIETLKQLGRYMDAETMGAVLNASFVAFSESPEGDEPLKSPADEGKPESEVQRNIGIENGIFVDVPAGRTVKFADMTRPNSAFDGFVLSISRQIGAAVGLPFEVLLKHFTASYSASRAALLEVWRFFRIRRAFLALVFCDPVFEAWMVEAVASEEIAAPGFFEDAILRRAYLQCEWIADGPGHVDPTKEVAYSVDKIKNRLSSRTREAMRLDGFVWSEVEQELAAEDELLRKSGALQPPSTPAGPAAPPVNAPSNGTVDEEDLQRERDNAPA